MRFRSRAWPSHECSSSSGGHATETLMKNEWGENVKKIKMEVKIRVTEPSGKHGIRGLNQSSPKDGFDL